MDNVYVPICPNLSIYKPICLSFRLIFPFMSMSGHFVGFKSFGVNSCARNYLVRAPLAPVVREALPRMFTC